MVIPQTTKSSWSDDDVFERILIDGLVRNMRDALPNASFIGFTSTAIKQNDANTRAVFGEYVSVYDIQQAVIDKATVPIYYESRIAKLSLNEAELPKVDSEFEDITEGEEEDRKQKLKTKGAALETLVGSEKRIRLIAEDLVQHFERRLEAMDGKARDGKAMVVCMSRRICVDLDNELIKLRPDWASTPDDHIEAEKKQSTVVRFAMTGSADDGADGQSHIRSKLRRKVLATRFKDTKAPFRIVVFRNVWLTEGHASTATTTRCRGNSEAADNRHAWHRHSRKKVDSREAV